MFGGGKSSKSSTNSTPSAADAKSTSARSEEKNSDAKMMAQSKDYGQDVNPHFICPITGELMTDPVVDNEGNSYERSAIEDWLSRSQTSPITRNALNATQLTTNRALKNMIEDYVAAGGQRVVGVPTVLQGIPSLTLSNLPPAPSNITVALTESKESVSVGDGTSNMCVTVVTPNGSSRVPSDIVIVLDKSGSMGNLAGTAGVEASSLSLLDVVKHAVKTIIAVLNENDRLSVISYSDAGKVLFELISMDAAGKRKANEILDALTPGGMTNLWDGLHKGMEVLSNRNKSGARLGASILLLTDGEPNIEPPRGHIPMLQRYRDTHDGKYPGVISTFGFGYKMDSPLLRAIAQEGDGMYCFIPDSGFVGTAFVNALSSTLTTIARDATLSIEPENGAEIVEVIGSYAHTSQSWGVQIPAGTFQYGQTKDYCFKIRRPSGTGQSALTVTLKYYDLETDGCQKTVTCDGPGITVPALSTNHAELERCRLLSVKTLDNVLELVMQAMPNIENALIEAKQMIIRHLEELKAAKNKFDNHNDAPIEGNFGHDQNKYKTQITGLIKDFEGQIQEALSRRDWFDKWGKHYLPSLKRAHELQQCNNFKDPGIQGYAGVLFTALRDDADDTFNSLPPPTPTVTRGSGGSSRSAPSSYTSAPTISMSAFNSSSAPCFHGDMLVNLANANEDGSVKKKKCADVQKGDFVQMMNNKVGEVVCVLKTIISHSNQANLVTLTHHNNLVVTYWHPVRVNGAWTFPCMLDGATLFDSMCDAVYSFVVRNVDDSEVIDGMIINDVECITLGHNIRDDHIASHPFFGSSSIIEDMLMNDSENYFKGLIVLKAGSCIKKDKHTGLINGFEYSRMPITANC